VAVAKVQTLDLSQNLVLTAEFKPFQEVDIMAKVAGFVSSIPVDVGSRVHHGQLLAVLEIPEMADDRARSQAALDRSQAEWNRAKDELKRIESAHDMAHLSYKRLADVARQRPGLVAQQEVDEAQSRDLVAEAQIAGAKSNITAAEQQVRVSTAELARIGTMFDYTRITAPFDGVVTRRYADTGSMIQAGTASNAMPLVKLSQNSLLRLVLPVPESAVPTVRIGQTVQVRVPTLHRSFPGRVARFADKVAQSTRTMDTEVDVPNPDLILIPGMFAEVDLNIGQRNHVVAVPVLALDSGEDEKAGQVVRITPENRVEMLTVKLGMRTANQVEIQSGLSEGDLVVLGNRSVLRPGELVQPKLSEIGKQ
jgi:RND family efflux transporter MFP subunit